MTILDTIIANKKLELAVSKKRASLTSLKRKLSSAKRLTRRFTKTGNLQLIAEVKAKSPSAGAIRSNINSGQLAKQFQNKGAAAVSVLTDKKFFGGSLQNLSLAKQAVKLPVLRKEFIIDPYQLYESKLYGADVVLLIAAVLKSKIGAFTQLALKLNLQPLIEVHNKAELQRILKTIKPSANIIIGINNRDLKTFKVDLNTSLRLIKMIPKTFIRISESGISDVSQLRRLSQAGFDAVLIGGGLAKNPKLFNYFR